MVTTLIMMTYTRFDKSRCLVCIRLRIKRYFIFDFAVEIVIVKLPDFRYDRVTDFFKLGLSCYSAELNGHIDIIRIETYALAVIYLWFHFMPPPYIISRNREIRKKVI